MASPKFDRERAIRILLDSVDIGDAKASAKHKVTIRTLQNYRKRLAGDPVLSQAFTRKKEQTDREWDTQRRQFLAEGFAKVRELVRNATLENLRDVVGALKVAGELQVTVDNLNPNHVGAGTDRQGPQDAEAAGGPGEGSVEVAETRPAN